ncbi:oxepin-CoA hydrolase, alternative type [Leisingera sp. XS_AS12]|uniref:oxepin-CoA hydrolase, alternative type n=1 Tax=Leisingera sp. XS_AS12 TaxID=3241294 RepID=UPI003511767C
MHELARCEDHGDHLIVVNSNTSKRNALSPDLYRVLVDGLDLAARKPRITSVVLRGEGGYFCAGGDLGLLATRREMPRDQRLARIEELHNVIRAVLNCPKPVIAAVEGGAAGAGVSLAFACDMIVSDRDATFTAAYVKAGLVPDGGLTSTLAAHLPRELVMRMTLLGEPVTAERLFSLGAISQIEPAGNVVPTALALAERLGAGPSGAQVRIKALVNSAHTSSRVEQMNAERDAMADAIAAAEAAEGIAAFLEKRRPDFTKARGTT